MISANEQPDKLDLLVGCHRRMISSNMYEIYIYERLTRNWGRPSLVGVAMEFGSKMTDWPYTQIKFRQPMSADGMEYVSSLRQAKSRVNS